MGLTNTAGTWELPIALQSKSVSLESEVCMGYRTLTLRVLHESQATAARGRRLRLRFPEDGSPELDVSNDRRDMFGFEPEKYSYCLCERITVVARLRVCHDAVAMGEVQMRSGAGYLVASYS